MVTPAGSSLAVLVLLVLVVALFVLVVFLGVELVQARDACRL